MKSTQCGNVAIIKIPGLHPIWLEGKRKTNLQRSSYVFSWNFCAAARDRAYHSLIYIWENKGLSEPGGDFGHLSPKSYRIHSSRSEHEMTNWIIFPSTVKMGLGNNSEVIKWTPSGIGFATQKFFEIIVELLEERKVCIHPRNQGTVPRQSLGEIFTHSSADRESKGEGSENSNSKIVGPRTARTPSQSQHASLSWKDESRSECKPEHISSLPTALKVSLISRSTEPSRGSGYESQLHHLLALGPWMSYSSSLSSHFCFCQTG